MVSLYFIFSSLHTRRAGHTSSKMTQSSRGNLRLTLPQARQATALSIVFCLCFWYASANNSWYCSDVYSTLQSLCDSCYAGYAKRSDQQTKTIDPFMDRKTAVDFFKRGTSRGGARGGIIDECCLKRCTTNELMLYCCEEKQREYFSFVGWLSRR
ncbi:uncharacterized protein LOC117291630 [Asterias rubens]|uniref:uncharacterized protein LOC117291630 n=1 Tax=Asterias rubens TaxID=7604 RepID=UPI00145563A0|nr:uncharacterized protein LOC117291630 [Asterias rubens]